MLLAMLGGGLGGLVVNRRGKGGFRSQRIFAARDAMAAAGEAWAAAAPTRPFALCDLGSIDAARAAAALEFYQKLKHEDLRVECHNHGRPIGTKKGPKYKLLNQLRAYAAQLASSSAASSASLAAAGASPASSSASACTSPSEQAQQSIHPTTVRARLAAQMRAGFKYDKKMKKGANAMLKASFAGGALEPLFGCVFPAAKKAKRVKITETDLGIGAPLRKALRYGADLVLVDGSMTARVDASGIHVSAKMRMER